MFFPAVDSAGPHQKNTLAANGHLNAVMQLWHVVAICSWCLRTMGFIKSFKLEAWTRFPLSLYSSQRAAWNSETRDAADCKWLRVIFQHKSQMGRPSSWSLIKSCFRPLAKLLVTVNSPQQISTVTDPMPLVVQSTATCWWIKVSTAFFCASSSVLLSFVLRRRAKFTSEDDMRLMVSTLKIFLSWGLSHRNFSSAGWESDFLWNMCSQEDQK